MKIEWSWRGRKIDKNR